FDRDGCVERFEAPRVLLVPRSGVDLFRAEDAQLVPQDVRDAGYLPEQVAEQLFKGIPLRVIRRRRVRLLEESLDLGLRVRRHPQVSPWTRTFLACRRRSPKPFS